jgi:cytidylate kinase
MVDWQRALRAGGPLVGEGRDLGTVVFPDAEVKLYLDADLETRARRRQAELASRGIVLDLPEVTEDLRARDDRDRSRADSPLRAAEGARVLDTSGMGVEQQVEAALAVVRAHPACPVGPGSARS